MSSPECELAMIAISGGVSSNASIPPASTQREQPERLDARAERHRRDPGRRAAGRSGRPRRPRRRRRDGRSRRSRCGSGGRGPAGRRAGRARTTRRGRSPGIAERRSAWRSRLVRSSGTGRGRRGYRAGALRAQASRRGSAPSEAGATMPETRTIDPGGARWRSRRPSTAWPSLHVSTHPAVLHKLAILRRRDDRAEEVPRDRPRAVVAARPRGAGRRPGPADHDRDAARDDRGLRAGRSDRPRADPARRPRAWSTRCSS